MAFTFLVLLATGNWNTVNQVYAHSKLFNFSRVGRKTSFFLCLSVELTGGILTALAPNFWLWAACRFMVGITIPAIYQIPFIIGIRIQ